MMNITDLPIFIFICCKNTKLVVHMITHTYVYVELVYITTIYTVDSLQIVRLTGHMITDT